MVQTIEKILSSRFGSGWGGGKNTLQVDEEDDSTLKVCYLLFFQGLEPGTQAHGSSGAIN